MDPKSFVFTVFCAYIFTASIWGIEKSNKKDHFSKRIDAMDEFCPSSSELKEFPLSNWELGLESGHLPLDFSSFNE